MARLFGTDGVRGIANVELTCEMAYRLGQAAAIYLGKTIVVGRDTRRSGDMLGAALSAGIMSAGGTVLEAGIIPTPAWPCSCAKCSAAAGAVISASHNPPEYNGIKFFDAQGFKLPDAVEDEIEAFIVNGGLEGEVAAARGGCLERRSSRCARCSRRCDELSGFRNQDACWCRGGRGHSAGKRLRHLHRSCSPFHRGAGHFLQGPAHRFGYGSRCFLAHVPGGSAAVGRRGERHQR